MTIQEPQVPPARLAFGVTFRTGIATVFKPFGTFAKAAAVPALLSVVILTADFCLRALNFVGIFVLDEDGLVVSLVQMIIGLLALLPFSLLGISISRRISLGPQSGWLPSPALGRRTWVFTGYLFLLLLFFIVFAVAGGFAVIVLLQELSADAGTALFLLGGLAGFCLLLYLTLRFSLVLPAVALDRKLGLFGSWRLTRRSGLKLLGVMLLLFLFQIVLILIGSIIGGGGTVKLGTPELVVPPDPAIASDWVAIVLVNLPRNLWNLAAGILVYAMSYGALASAYVQLSGWNAPRRDILERFE